MTGARRWVVAAVLAVLGLAVGLLLGARLLGGTQPDRASVTCTDSAGDSARIQKAIDDSAVGAEVVIGGRCSITATVVLRGERAYRGLSARTTLRAADGSNLVAVLASDAWMADRSFTGEPITLRDLTIDANAGANPRGGDGVVIRSWNSEISGLRIRDARGNGLRIAGSSRDGTPIQRGHTEVQGTIRNLDVTGSGAHGIFVQDAGNSVTDWNLLDSWVGRSGGDGIRLEHAAGWRIAGNHLYANGGSGIDAQRLFATEISGNYVEDFGPEGHAITVTLQGGSVGSTLDGNRLFQGNPGGGDTVLAVTGVVQGTGVVHVSDNVVHGRGTGTGLSYADGAGRLQVSSTGNDVTAVTEPRTGVTPRTTS